MKKIKDIHIFILLFVLMVVRVFVSGRWFGCVVIAGFLISLFDIMRIIFDDNNKLRIEKQKYRYGIIFVITNIVFGVGVVILTLNAIIEIWWVNTTLFLDELTLITLILTLSQDMIVTKINKIIREG